MIHCACRQCGSLILVDPADLGKAGRCPKCRAPVRYPPMGRPKVIEVELAGAEQVNPDGKARQKVIRHCKTGQEVLLIRQPGSRTDSSAVLVATRRPEPIGTLPVSVASELAEHLDNGGLVEVRISEIAGGGFLSNKPRTVKLKITKFESA